MKMIDDYYLVNGDFDTLAFHSKNYFDGKKELYIDRRKYGEFELRERTPGECEIIFRHMVDPLGDDMEEHLESIIISYFQVLKDRGVEFSFIDQESFKTIERTLLKAIASEVSRLFYDRMKEFDKKVFYASQIVDRKKFTFTHFYKDVYWSKDNHVVEVTDMIYAPRVNPRESGPPRFGKALEIKAWQIQTDRVWLTAKYSPRFANIIEGMLSKFDQLETNPAEVSKSLGKKWKPWEHMPGSKEEDRLLVKLAEEMKTSRELGNIFFCDAGVIDNRLWSLRRRYPKARIGIRQRRTKRT